MLLRIVCLLVCVALATCQPLPKLLEELLWRDTEEEATPKKFEVYVPKEKAGENFWLIYQKAGMTFEVGRHNYKTPYIYESWNLCKALTNEAD